MDIYLEDIYYNSDWLPFVLGVVLVVVSTLIFVRCLIWRYRASKNPEVFLDSYMRLSMNSEDDYLKWLTKKKAFCDLTMLFSVGMAIVSYGLLTYGILWGKD